MSADAELAAMTAVRDAVEGLDLDGRRRVLRWAVDHYGVRGFEALSRNEPTLKAEGAPLSDDLPALFSKAAPVTESERVLVAGYWMQEIEGDNGDLDAYRINSALKQLGYGVTNVTRCFDSLISARPALALQVRKSGRSQQARKRYRITEEGKRRVVEMAARQTQRQE